MKGGRNGRGERIKRKLGGKGAMKKTYRGRSGGREEVMRKIRKEEG